MGTNYIRTIIFPFGQQQQKIWAPVWLSAALFRTRFHLAWRKTHLATFFHCSTHVGVAQQSFKMFVFSPGSGGETRPNGGRARQSSEARWNVSNLVKIHTRLRVLRLLKYVCLYFISTQTQKLGHSRRQLKLNAVQFFTTFPLLNLAAPSLPLLTVLSFCSRRDQ